jgi:hypothetical protein
MILYSHSLSVQKNWETFNEDLGFFPHQEKSHKPKKKKKRKQTNKQTNPLSLSLFIHYCLPCIPCSSLMHDVQVSKTRRPSLTSLRTNQTVPTGTQEIAPNKERKGSERERESFDGWIEVGRRSLLRFALDWLFFLIMIPVRVYICACVCVVRWCFWGRQKSTRSFFEEEKRRQREREREREREEGQRIRMGLVGSDISQATCC